MTFPHRALPVLALGAALLFAGACSSAEDGPGTAAGAPSSTTAASAAADNTAAICKSSGEAARTVVIDVFTKMAEVMKGDTAPADADLNKIYQSTFTSLRDTLQTESGKATDPEFAAVLSEIATEADKIATAGDPEAVGTQGFEAALKKLETYCPTGTPGASGTPAAPVAAGTVGAKGSACVLPVSFAVPEKWKLDAIETDDGPLAELTRKGSLQMACEANARTVGLTGFLRVWIDQKPAHDAQAALKSFLTGAKTRNVTYTPITLGGTTGVELKYQNFSELLEEYSDRRAFAVATPKGAVVIELSGLESDDPTLQAAYDQAKNTLKTNP